MRVRVRVTVVCAGESADVEVSAPGGTTVAAVATELLALAGAHPPGAALAVDGAVLSGDAVIGAAPLLEGAVVTVAGDRTGERTGERTGGRLAGRSDPTIARGGLVYLHVLSGPDAGGVYPVEPGRLRIGRAGSCEVTIADPELSREHAELDIGWDGVRVRDLGSTNGTTIDGPEVGAAPVDVPPGSTIRVGASRLRLAALRGAPAATRADLCGGLTVNRPPRIEPAPVTHEVTVPTRDPSSERAGFPVTGVLVPLALAAAMVAMWGPRFAVLAALTPVVIGGGWLAERLRGWRNDRKAEAAYAGGLAQAEAAIAAALASERGAAAAAAPDLAEIWLIATSPTTSLWRRRPDDDDALLVRVGTGERPSGVRVVDSGHGSRAGTTPGRPSLVQPDAAATVALRTAGVLGIAGPRPRALGLARAVLAQLAVLHSPRDLRMVVLAPRARAPDWAWTRWLPHLRPRGEERCTALVGVGSAQVAARVEELLGLLDSHAGTGADHPPWRQRDRPGPAHTVVLLDGARELRGVAGMARLLADGPAAGIHTVCVDDSDELPPDCRARALIAGSSGTDVYLDVTGEPAAIPVAADLVSPRWAEDLARALAPLRDATPDAGAEPIPTSVLLGDVLDWPEEGLPSAAQVAAAWTESAGTGHDGAAVAIGVDTRGTFTVDLCRDGPHALVAGTTGAGKSELLRSWILSLALARRPDQVAFILIDYKGGAAFSVLADLPHVVGAVTDLDAGLSSRALRSLGAELRRREQVLLAAGASDIAAYTGADPLPRLVIVVDEFATLAEELPDFVTGLVAVAQRGRSLGLHLILATQRPGSAVSADILANTNLRIALRVTGAGESTDVIGTTDAASISASTPGRAYARRGPDLPTAFQAARFGSETRDPADPTVTPLPWVQLGEPPPVVTAGRRVAGPGDLARVVANMRGAAAGLDIEPVPSPWLGPLPSVITADALEPFRPTGAARISTGPPGVSPVPYGLADLPARQTRRLACLDVETGGHLLVVGAPRTGRSTTLRTIAAGLATHTCCADVHLYGIDCGNGALASIAALPHCGAVVTSAQPERVDRLLRRLAATIRARTAALAGGGYGSIAELRAGVVAAERLPYLVLMIDRWEGFVADLDTVDAGRLTEAVHALLRDGASAGLRVIITADRSGLTGPLRSFIGDTVVLDLPDRSDLLLAGIRPVDIPLHRPPGRGVTASGTHLQVALPGSDPTGGGQRAALAEIGAKATARDQAVPGSARPFRIGPLPARVECEQPPASPPAGGSALWCHVGTGGDAPAGMGVDLDADGPAFVVAGQPRTGRSTALATIGRSLVERGCRVLAVTPRPSPVRGIDGLHGIVGDPLQPDLIRAALGTTGPCAILVDDAELLSGSPVAAALGDYLRSARDAGRALVVAGAIDDLAHAFQGFAAEACRHRTGLLLTPTSVLDGGVLGVRLSQATLGGPPGRAVLVVRGECTAVQVPSLPTALPTTLPTTSPTTSPVVLPTAPPVAAVPR